MSTTSVKVAVRVRPLTAKELLDDARECISCYSETQQIVIGIEKPSFVQNGPDYKAFTFDNVFDTLSTQDQVYQGCAQSLVDTFLDGFNATIFAYGQTGSGKTHTMGTGLDNLYDSEGQGIIPRAINDIFNCLNRKQQENPLGFKWALSLTFIELYNEDLADLLNPRPRTAGSGSWGGLTIREDSQGNIIWSGIKEEQVESPEDLLSLLQKGTLCRTTGSTDMNASSSRSHAIFSLILKQQKWIPQSEAKQTGNDEISAAAQCNPTTHPEGSWQKITSKFHFVDLAGSERLKKTNAEGDRKREGININKGLLVLGNVIHALSDEQRVTASGHVPYRESKLTRLLQDSLGGNSQTLMLSCVSPSTTNYAESLNTLQYANRAKEIKNKVSMNQEWSNAANEKELRTLRAMVSKLQTEITLMKQRPDKALMPAGGNKQFEQQLHQAQITQAAMSQDMEAALKELEETKFDKYRFIFKYQKLTDRIQQMNQEIETFKSSSISGEKTTVDAYVQQMALLKSRLAEAEDRLFWYKDVVERISNRKPIQQEFMQDELEDELDLEFDNKPQPEVLPNQRAHDLLILKIQKDILKYEKQVASMSRKDAEYEMMKNAYDQKLKNLQDQLSQVQKERDLAMQKVTVKEQPKAGTLAIKSKYEKDSRRMENEIQDLKKKLNSRANNKFRQDQITKSLKSQIGSLKVEKQLLEKKLKEETEKNREILNAKIRELGRMKKKQEKTAEIARKLVKGDKQEEPGLRKSSSSYKLSDSNLDLKSRKERTRSLSPDSMSILFQEKDSTFSLGGLKQALEKELWLYQHAKKIQIAMSELVANRERLVSELKELLAEREKCVEMDAEDTGFLDHQKPQYMDDRLNVIQAELEVLQVRLDELAVQTMQIQDAHQDKTLVSLQDGQIAWNNTSSILNGLKVDELAPLSLEFLDELVSLRVYKEDLVNRISEKEKIVYELRAALDLTRNAAMESSMDYQRRLNDSQGYAKSLVSLLKDCYEAGKQFPDTFEQFMLELSDRQTLESFVAMTDHQLTDDSAIPEAAENERSKHDRFEIVKEEKNNRRSSFDRLIQLGTNAFSKLMKKHEKSNLSRSVSFDEHDEDEQELPGKRIVSMHDMSALEPGPMVLEKGLLKKLNNEQNEKNYKKLKTSKSVPATQGNVFSRLAQSHTISSDIKRKAQ